MQFVIDSRSVRFDPSRQLTQGLRAQRFAGEGYAEDAFIPELVDPDRASGSSRSAPAGQDAGVELFDLDLDLVTEWRTAVVPTIFERGQTAERAKAEIDSIGDQVVAAANIGRPSSDLRRTQASDLVVDRAGVRSTAFDHNSRVRMGLHLDTHNQRSLADRADAPVLCSANLGAESRYLHFIPVTVAAILEELGTAPDEIEPRELKNQYLASLVVADVIRLEVLPGQGYVCNTQNLIHDGATNNIGCPDISSLTLCHQTDSKEPRS